MPSDSLFGQNSIAAEYATRRPPVHRQILDHVGTVLSSPRSVDLALDLGCGAGASTSALILSGLGRRVLGVDPSTAMIAQAKTHTNGACFVIGTAEALPLGSGSVGLITAAGVLNFTNAPDFFAEAKRVLSIDGVLVVYDFATGCQSAACPDLASWYFEWLRRWPKPTSWAAPISRSTFDGAPLDLFAYKALTVTATFDLRGYLDYLMTESNVADAVRSGTSMGEIRGWCETQLRPIFGKPLEVEFDSYHACLSQPE
jgi:SAM-dependent methyltransferase